MRVVQLLTVVVLVLARSSVAQSFDCRQTWMPPDAPAFCAWQTEPSLPEPRAYHAVATSDNRIYVLGGFRFEASTSQVIYYDTVERSTIDANGRLSAWRAEPSFNKGRSGAAAVSVGDCLFLIGGSSSTPTALNYYDDVQFTQIGSDGHLSGWTTSPSRLRTPRSNHSVVPVTTSQGTFLDVVAGVTQIGNDTVHLDTVEFAKVGPACTIGDWTIANYHLKGGRSTPQALVVRNNVVVFGGWGDLDLIDVYDDVQLATARADGSPAPWRTSSHRLTTGIYGHATILAESAKPPSQSLLLSVGGQPGSGAYADWISYARVLPGVALPDAIGIWRIAPTGKLPTGRAGLGAAQLRGRLYVIGGNNASGQYYGDVLSADFDFGRP